VGPVTALAGVCLQDVERGAHEGGKRPPAARLRPVSSKATHPPTYLPLHRGDLPPGPRAGGPIPWVLALCSRAGAPLALREHGGARLELPPAGSRAGGGTDPPPHVVTSGGLPPPI